MPAYTINFSDEETKALTLAFEANAVNPEAVKASTLEEWIEGNSRLFFREIINQFTVYPGDIVDDISVKLKELDSKALEEVNAYIDTITKK